MSLLQRSLVIGGMLLLAILLHTYLCEWEYGRKISARDPHPLPMSASFTAT